MPDLPDSIDLIVGELQVLHKGRSTQTADLDSRLGPHLRTLAGNDAVNRRQALIAELKSCVLPLPPDVAKAITASLALEGEFRNMPHFDARAARLAEQEVCNLRTAKRHIKAAEQLLAEQIATVLRRRSGITDTTLSGWYLKKLETLLRLDTPTPEAEERRRIVCVREGLREVVVLTDLPRCPGRPEPELTPELLYGGQLIGRDEPFTGRFEFIIQLPEPLGVGQEHEFGLLLRMNPGKPMRSHYILTPEYQCDALDLRVRFHPQRLPRWVRRVEGESVRVFDQMPEPRESAALDAAGEIHERFRNLTMYLGYGVQWNP